jgi:hypothetical protein
MPWQVGVTGANTVNNVALTICVTGADVPVALVAVTVTVGLVMELTFAALAPPCNTPPLVMEKHPAHDCATIAHEVGLFVAVNVQGLPLLRMTLLPVTGSVETEQVTADTTGAAPDDAVTVCPTGAEAPPAFEAVTETVYVPAATDAAPARPVRLPELSSAKQLVHFGEIEPIAHEVGVFVAVKVQIAALGTNGTVVGQLCALTTGGGVVGLLPAPPTACP